MSSPRLSVVMPVRNALPYLDAAVESILGQTHSDFEFIIRDDFSTDGSRERLRYWASRDQRIRLFEGEKGLGPAGSSNWVVAQASASIVARMDADDISHPDRFRRQLQTLDENPTAVLVGTLWHGIDRFGRIVRPPYVSSSKGSGFAAPFAHGSIMFRRESFNRIGGYRAECDFWEDLDLYIRMAKHGRVLVLAEPLYQYRFSETSTRLTSRRAQVEHAVDLMLRCRSLVEQGEEYEHLLTGEAASGSARKLNPHAFLSLAFITLWSGLRPPVLQRMLRRAELRPDVPSAKALIVALWATLSPRTLRFVLRRRMASGSRRVRKDLGRTGVFEWPIKETQGG